MCGNLSREVAAASYNGFNICMKMVVEIGLTAINTQQIKHWNQTKEQRDWERGNGVKNGCTCTWIIRK